MRKKLGYLVAAAVLAASLPATAATLLSDNFDTENGGAGALSYTGFANFTVATGTTVDLIGNGYYDFLPGNGLYVDLDGNNQGILSTKTQFAPGTYTVSFSLAGKNTASGPASVQVTLDGFSATYTLSNTQPFTTQSFTTTTTTASVLSFASLTPGVSGLLLDNVSVSSADASSNVPEPATVGLLAAGLAGIAARRRRNAR